MFPYGEETERKRDRNKCIKRGIRHPRWEDDRFVRGGDSRIKELIKVEERREKKFSRTTAWRGEGARRREDRAILHVLVARVLYELWELRSAISAANAILMYASELMSGRGGGGK